MRFNCSVTKRLFFNRDRRPISSYPFSSFLGILLFTSMLSLLPLDSWAAEKLVVYSGRAERLIKPVLDAFQKKTGIQVNLLSSKTTELVNRLQAEKDRTPADVFITNDAGSLERAREIGLLRPLKLQEIERTIPSQFRAADNSWIGLSGRIWIVVYNKNLVDPSQISSILDLAKPQWKGKLAIPHSGSEYLHAGASVIKAAAGDEAARTFLKGIKTNAGNEVYGKSSQIVRAVSKGQVALGIVNHYYIFRELSKNPKAPIAALIPDQTNGGIGAIMNVAGIGVIHSAKHVEEAKRLVTFLVSRSGQKLFADFNKEYPLHPEVQADPQVPPRKSFQVAPVPLARLAELREPTLALIEQEGLR